MTNLNINLHGDESLKPLANREEVYQLKNKRIVIKYLRNLGIEGFDDDGKSKELRDLLADSLFGAENPPNDIPRAGDNPPAEPTPAPQSRPTTDAETKPPEPKKEEKKEEGAANNLDEGGNLDPTIWI